MIKLELQIPESFLQEETRCGYTVSRRMKEIWAVEMDLACQLIKVCRKYKIKIFASSGTMLGAVRHQGFIPWDDDMDFMMFREDYDRLCQVAEKEFQDPYFFQTEYTDQGSIRGHAQLRNSHTTAILPSELGFLHINQGIFIDIFPLDAVNPDEKAYERQKKMILREKKKALAYAVISSRFYPSRNPVKNKVKKAMHGNDRIREAAYKKEIVHYRRFEELCRMYNNIPEAAQAGALSFDFIQRQKADFDEVIDVPFEFITIPIGKNYDHALRNRFGDYRKFVRGGSVHGKVLFDVDRPYTYYTEEPHEQELWRMNEEGRQE